MFSWLRRKLHIDQMETMQQDYFLALEARMIDIRQRLEEVDVQITTMASGSGMLAPSERKFP